MMCKSLARELSLLVAVCCLTISATTQTATVAATSVTTAATSAVPQLITYGSVLKNAEGETLTGITGVTFLLYKDEHGGAPLWLESQNVTPDKTGHYSVQLGSTSANGLSSDLFVSGEPRWLAVQISNEAEQPRVLLVAVPYAMKAADAETIGGLPPSAFVRASSSDRTSGATNLPQTPASVTGSGTTHYIPIWTSTTALGNSALFQNGHNVGLGTTTPAHTLEVKGSMAATVSSGSGVSGTSTSGSGVAGTSSTALGVQGTSSSNVGVYGSSKSYVGVFGQSNSSYGVYGTSPSSVGVGGVTTSGFGVYGASSSGTGVYAISGSGFGLYASSAGVGTTTSLGGQLNVQATITGADGLRTYGYNATAGSGQFGGFGAVVQGGNGDPNNFSEGGYGVYSFGGNADQTGGSSALGGSGVFGAGGNADFGGDGGVFSFAAGTTGNGYAAYFDGDINVTGAVLAGTKDFKIDHPLDPANKYLYHASVESSEMMNIYTGNVTTDAQGYGTVRLPEWFEAVNQDFRYQLTVIGQFAQAIVAREIQNNQFVIQTNAPDVKVSWTVTAVRHDAFAKAHPLVVEEAKNTLERGSYIHPELYGAPEQKSVTWVRHPEAMKRAKAMREQRQASHSN